MWPKCPKCKKRNVRITERWSGHTIQWDNGDGQDDGTLEPGDPASVHGECRDCGHCWRFRGIIQIKREWWSCE